jgi:hypothetical protein
VKVFLMHRDRDFDLDCEPPVAEDALVRDLELETLFAAMAAGDRYLFEIARRAVLLSLTEPEQIRYRQRVLADCLERRTVVRQIYELAVEAVEGKKSAYGFYLRDSPETILNGSVNVLEFYIRMLRRLRAVADRHAGAFRSDGFTRLFAMLRDELRDEYLGLLEAHLGELRFRRGILLSAGLGTGNKGRDHVVRRPNEQSWLERLTPGSRPAGLSFTIPDRDEHGFRALGDLRNRGINVVANALAQSTDHIESFFALLRAELAFYVGCLNLRERLEEKGEPACFPDPLDGDSSALSARGLYDVSLTLHLDERTVGNDLRADGRSLVMITGANQGGKSTFLRSVGVAQLMTQSGMFVGAERFRASVCRGVFTHYKREEDASMEAGKLDEELGRMSEIADAIASGCILLCNESFASTNEREGSEIARQVVRALLEQRIRVIFVTHMFDLADGFYRQGLDAALFLRAERQPDGRRTFRLVEGEPLPTSYGEDSYRRIFGATGDAEAAAVSR